MSFHPFPLFPPIAPCAGKSLEKLTAADEAEIIKLMLAEAITRKQIPSYPTLVSGNEVILSTQNIGPVIVSNLPGLKLVPLSPADIQARANRQGDLMYLEFDKLEIRGSCVAVTLCNLWADGTSTIDTGPKSFLGEGCLQYGFYKRGQTWIGEFISGWIS